MHEDNRPSMDAEQAQPPQSDSPKGARLEIAHVLFTDIVGYSRLPMEQQTTVLQRLQEIVRSTRVFQEAQSKEQLISLPTGDGMALVFFGSPEDPTECAVEIGRALKDSTGLRLRMGIHTGPVYRVSDINAQMNVAGGGINTAQRVMDCGDAGHILLSKTVAEVLGQLSRWKDKIHDLGEAEVKHGIRVHLLNLYSEEIGNPEVPQKVSGHKAAEGKSEEGVPSLPRRIFAKLAATVSRRPRYLLPVALVVLVATTLALGYLKLVPAQKGTQRWLELGVEALRDGTYYKASKMLKRAVEADSRNALAHARYAESLAELDHMEEAMRAALSAERLGREFPIQPVDKLYLDAINATVTRDFEGAVRAYKRILDQSSSAEDRAHAYVDLGHAYSKGGDMGKAIECFTEAARLNPQGAATFLRLGALSGRAQDWEAAQSALNTAEGLYRDISNPEGLAETYYQRGIILTDLGRLDGAREQFRKALEHTRATDNVHQRIRAQLQLSRVSCLTNEVVQAQQLAEQALSLAGDEGLEDLTAQGLVDVGNAFYFRKDFASAGDYYQRAIRFAQKYKGRNEARARLQLGIMQIEQNDIDVGRRNVEQALEYYQRHNYPDESFDGRLQLGLAERKRGNYETALQNFQELLRLAEEKNQQTKVAVAREKIGLVLLLLERYPGALEQFEKSLEIGESLRDDIGIGYCLLNAGNALWRMGRYDGARRSFRRATELANRPSGYKAMLPEIFLSEAEMALSERRPSEVKLKIKQLLSVVDPGQSADLVIEEKRLFGLAQVLSGGKAEGVRACEEAVRLAESFGEPGLLSRAKLTFAQAAVESGGDTVAMEVASRLVDEFISREQHESAWQALLIMARAARQTGDGGEAASLITRAEEELSTLRKQWGDVAFNSYVSRPDVRHYRSLPDRGSNK